jgi:hypothetical protein
LGERVFISLVVLREKRFFPLPSGVYHTVHPLGERIKLALRDAKG